MQHQAGGSDCGLFAIAFAVALCFGLNPSKLIFEQSKMRDHLLHCLKENEFTNFPFSINPMWKKKKTVINKETLFCFCRGLYDSEMAKCISCHEWFHLRCLSSREVKHIKDDVTFHFLLAKNLIFKFYLLGPRQRMLVELYCFRLVCPSICLSVCPWSL